jgi:murein DD-endopeptidase MepM/ murein hydrolase activator NlpD
MLLFVTIESLVKGATAADAVISDPYNFEDYPPPPFLSPMGAYPNPLQIAELERRRFFHPVVKFPRQCWDRKRFVCPHGDYTNSSSSSSQLLMRQQLVNAEEFQVMQQQQQRSRRHLSAWKASGISKWKRFLRSIPGYSTLVYPWKRMHGAKFIGRYDEDRVIYQSPLFLQNPETEEKEEEETANHSTTTTVDCTSRTVHVGIDLLGDVGTPVYACTDGIVHAAGYNAAWGDYGNVMVVQHWIVRQNNQSSPRLPSSNATSKVFFYALYGHLDHASIRNKKTR